MKLIKRFGVLTGILTLGIFMSACTSEITKEIKILVKDASGKVAEATVVLTAAPTGEEKTAIDEFIANLDEEEQPAAKNFYKPQINKTDENGMAHFRLYTMYAGTDVISYTATAKMGSKTGTTTIKAGEAEDPEDGSKPVFTITIK